MKMDINKDRIDDYEMVKNIIKMNGGVIDAELQGGRQPGGQHYGQHAVLRGRREAVGSDVGGHAEASTTPLTVTASDSTCKKSRSKNCFR